MRADLNKSHKRLFFSMQLSGQNNLLMLYMVKETAIEYFGGVLTKLACVAGRRKGRERVKRTTGVLGREEEGTLTLMRCFFLLSLPFDACHRGYNQVSEFISLGMFFWDTLLPIGSRN